MFLVALVAVSFIFFSFVGKDTPTEGLTIGDKAPDFKICSERQMMDLEDLRGKYVVLSFWASYDASSRMQNAALSHAVSKNKNVEMVSVSFDDYKSIFDETMEGAVRRFQMRNVLPPSGIIDKATWNALVRNYNKYIQAD